MHTNYSWNFHQNIFTLTISFIVLNAAIEFVLIYRPHPVEYQAMPSLRDTAHYGLIGHCFFQSVFWVHTRKLDENSSRYR